MLHKSKLHYTPVDIFYDSIVNLQRVHFFLLNDPFLNELTSCNRLQDWYELSLALDYHVLLLLCYVGRIRQWVDRGQSVCSGCLSMLNSIPAVSIQQLISLSCISQCVIVKTLSIAFSLICLDNQCDQSYSISKRVLPCMMLNHEDV